MVDIVDDIPEKVAGFGAIAAFSCAKRALFAGELTARAQLIIDTIPNCVKKSLPFPS
jgi:hypothetical protein